MTVRAMAGRLRVARIAVAARLVVLLIAPLPALVACAATVAEGERAYASGRYETARTIWIGLADSGDPQAAFRLGTLYEQGSGVPPDPGTASCWYRRAASGGVVAAAFNVAVMSDSGRGVPHDPAAAALWYARAAAFGFPRAEYNLGQLYEAGDGVPRNLSMAAAWYHMAADAGITAAADHVPPPRRPRRRSAELTPVNLDDPSDMNPVGGVGGVPLTWAAPPQPQPVSYYVEVMPADAPATRPLFSASSEVSAVLAPLPPGQYAGRVFVEAVNGSHYVAGGWTRFSVAASLGRPVCTPGH